ncbi:MAG: patatin-like phospholipase family protein [Cyclobacteriaceae bacterium]|nr:patatin-like phospholipase family protein [Cyclobacteriaceae bacterium]
MRILFPFFIWLLTVTAYGQKVALVLSGGGAKGIAHVGVIKALEEHNIPIDYIVGTSMGGIVGGCYAAGMSPLQIEEMMLSDDFLRWVTGLPEKGFNFHYYNDDISPGFLRVDLSLDSTLSVQFNTSIANDASLNFALTEKMAVASALSRNNFDNLFVPLRVMAADVFSQAQVVLKHGSLSDALRATQTVPFFYTPIRIDNKYLFDGGVYNNFPVDVAVQEFEPDVLIGSNVSSKIFKEYPYNDDDKLIHRSLMYMLLDKSDPSAIPDSGVYIQPNLEGYTSFDFARAKALIDSGYVQTLRQLDELKTKTARSANRTTVQQRREAFLSKGVPVTIEELTFKNFSANQRKYIRRIFNVKGDDGYKPMSLHEAKQGYFKLITEPYFGNVHPSIRYDSIRSTFQLQLTQRPQKNFQVDFGGVMATRNISNLYLGLDYYFFKNSLTHFFVGAQTGSFYKSLMANTRIDFPFLGRFYIQPEVVMSEYDFVEGTDLIQKITPTVLSRFDRKAGVRLGWPIGNTIKATAVFNGFTNKDRYSNTKAFNSLDTLDDLGLRGFKTGFIITTSNLDRKQYASAGKSISVSAFHFSARENYIPGTTSVNTTPLARNHQWFRVRATMEQYFNRGAFRPGFYAEAVFSNQPFFRNYFGTIINTPGFMPLQDSRTLILENFRSPNYLTVGARNVIVIRPRTLDLRLESYVFKPLAYIQQGANQEAIKNGDLTTFFFAGTAGLVYHSPIGPLSLSANYYDDDENRFGVLFHVGFLLFNKHTLED